MGNGSAFGLTARYGFAATTSGPKTRAWRRSGKVLEAYDAAHIAVGHTVQKDGRIRPRFGNKVFLIDTGMLSSYYPGGRAVCPGNLRRYPIHGRILGPKGGPYPSGFCSAKRSSPGGCGSWGCRKGSRTACRYAEQWYLRRGGRREVTRRSRRRLEDEELD